MDSKQCTWNDYNGHPIYAMDSVLVMYGGSWVQGVVADINIYGDPVVTINDYTFDVYIEDHWCNSPDNIKVVL